MSATPKKHGERQVQELTKSIQRYGFRSPVLIDKNGAIIAGTRESGSGKACGTGRGSVCLL